MERWMKILVSTGIRPRYMTQTFVSKISSQKERKMGEKSEKEETWKLLP